MKNKSIFIIISFLTIILTYSSCKKDKYEGYKNLTPINYSIKSDTINIKRGIKLVYNGLSVQSKLKVSYEWSYGPAKPGTDIKEHKFLSIKSISNSPTIDYRFFDIGTFILRLKMDNGESIRLLYFVLNINAGFDDGIMVLNNDGQGKSHLSFFANLTKEQKEAGETDFYPDIFPDILDNETVTNATDMYLAVHNDARGESHSYASFLVSTNDNQGTIYAFDPYSLSLKSKSQTQKEIGSYCKEFGGFFSIKGSGAAYLSNNGDICRYDLVMNFSAKVYSWGKKYDRAISIISKASNDNNKRYPYYMSDTGVCNRWSQSRESLFSPKGQRIINMASSRNNANYIYILTQDRDNPHNYNVWYGRNSLRTDLKLKYSFNSAQLNMDKNSKIITTTKSLDVYYNYKNAIYRWSLLSKPSDIATISLPENEIITDISTNYNPGSKDSENLLYVASYNKSSNAQHKGSLYIYDLNDNHLIKSYHEKIDKTIRIIYKYRFN